VIRGRLAEQLGADPGPELRALHQAILRGDTGEAAPPRIATLAPPTPSVPAQLPADVYGFAGRADQLTQLDALIAADDRPTAVVIIAVLGTAGVGKTALAIHWAHAVRSAYPDGQLYVNLRGYDQAGSAMASTVAMRGFLDALGVPPERIPPELDAQAALY